jgi:hypothetical protein
MEASLQTLPLDWTPGNGGLLALVSPDLVSTITAQELPVHARAVQTLHLTLLRSASMLPLVPVLGPVWGQVRASLPPVPAPRFTPRVHVAIRPPHPTRDPADMTRARHTWFVVPVDQEPLRAALSEIVCALDLASRARGGPAFRHPEPRRLFHVSLFNDRGGDGRRSIGDIHLGDCAPARAG